MNVSLDIETYSDVELTKCGVYAYADSPNFTILLVAYAFGDEETQIVDLACGEALPQEVLKALSDESVIKTAFNAMFERICLSRYLGIQLSSVSWQCTAVQAAMLALPLSLEGVGEVLNIERKKLKEGADLVRYFSIPCKPTQANSGRTRNLPEHAPDKWERFKRYCIRDVDAEREIRQKLRNFPIPDSEMELYRLDQEINDRGILVDRDLVSRAVECDLRYTESATARAYELTGLDNPNSVVQIKKWLSGHGVEVESLDKKAVKGLLPEADGEVLEVLKLRLLMAKTSVKKYEAIERSVCSDGRVHGLFQFYGANRTGRWCLTGDHEVLTTSGWKRLDEWCGGEIACWSPVAEQISFQKATQVQFDYTGPMYSIESQRCSQVSTPDHRMAHWTKAGKWEADTIERLSPRRFAIPFTGRRQINSSLEHFELRILIMTQADGHYTRDGDLRFHFSKQRKIERCKSLLRKAGIVFSISKRENSTVIMIKSRMMPLWLRAFRDKTFNMWLMDESADVVFDELEMWDAYRCGPNSIQYSTTNKQNADIIQAFAHLSGRAATIIKKCRYDEKWQDAYVVNIWLNPLGRHEIREKPEKVSYCGIVYCAETPTGYFVVRRNGKVWITGNSGRLVQVQNLPQNHLPDLELARNLIKHGRYEDVELLFDSTPGVLSELIRTAFVPRPGTRFIIADFSAIEARVLAWLSGEKWRLDVFSSHGKIYEASAASMFGVPIEEIGKGSPLRQEGKISELALGYGGSVGALTSMGALDMGLTEEELPVLVNQWRSANPHITKFWWDVDAAAIAAVQEKKATAVGSVAFSYKSGILFVTLPSGRKLSYVKPRMAINKFGREGLTYEGIGESKKWLRIETYGPKLTENIVQATSRDLLALAMLRLRSHGFTIVMHVHDEAVLEVPEGEGSVGEICTIMAEAPGWAAGLPLRADGYECGFYKKE